MRSSSGCFISLLGNSSGCFTVKSAYLVAMSMGSREETGNFSNDAGPAVLFVRASPNLQNKFCGPVDMQKRF
ncbi:hypothetical protein CMV_015441 [Castanea mollissima]|uniref:Uncharacterized protein n=1 Tax=Castanea mollissima TaxID=60419 RepID=A0A8J4QUI1_9ROSI|nr:hypothetical protein CMV_015441 [Castanea mollissima]